MTSLSRQYGQIPFAYINGFGISNDATTPNTKLDIALGSCLDSTNTFQVNTTAPIIINAATSGLNGIDTGSLAASTVYAVYIVFDPVDNNPTGAVISLSTSTPYLPFGYSAFRLIGFITTDATVHFLPGYWTSGNSGSRLFMYDAPQATSITTGNATTYTAIDLTTLVPLTASNQRPVWIYSDFTPGAASRQLFMQPTGGTGDAIKITGQVTSVHVTSNSLLMALTATAKPEISYKVSNTGDAVAINVAGYEFLI